MLQTKLVGLAVLLFALVACPQQPIEQTARDGIATAKGMLDDAKSRHPECQTDAVSKVCKILKTATSAKDTLIDALSLYCAGAPDPGAKSFDEGGPCKPDKSVGPRLSAAMKSLDQIMADAKGL
jgi:hypothetical protein